MNITIKILDYFNLDSETAVLIVQIGDRILSNIIEVEDDVFRCG